MKLIVGIFFIFSMGLSYANAQQSNSPKQAAIAIPALNKAEQDSLERDKKNGTIYSKVNKDGVIEITRKEFDKIPAERQAVLRNDKNYKIIEDK